MRRLGTMVESVLSTSREPSINEKILFQKPPARDPWAKFLVEPGNEMAMKAVRAVLAEPSRAFNPLLIHGPASSGKTQLLSGLVYQAERQAPGSAVYTTGRAFAAVFRKSAPEGGLGRWRERFAKARFWVMDNVDALAGKLATDREMVSLLDSLRQRDVQLVFSSREHPRRVEGLSPRLQDRLLSGIDIRVETLSEAAALSVLTRAWAGFRKSPGVGRGGSWEPGADRGGVFLPLVRRFRGDLRSALRILISLRQASGGRLPTEEAVRAALRGNPAAEALTLDAVLAAVAESWGIPPEKISSSSRHPSLSPARQAYCFLSRELKRWPLAEIGQALGRSAPWVANSAKKWEEAVRQDSKFQAMGEILLQKLASSPSFDREGRS